MDFAGLFYIYKQTVEFVKCCMRKISVAFFDLPAHGINICQKKLDFNL